MPKEDKEFLLSSDSDQSDGIIIENELAGQIPEISTDEAENKPDFVSSDAETSQTFATAVPTGDSVESVQSSQVSDVQKSETSDVSVGEVTGEGQDSVGALKSEAVTPAVTGSSNEIIVELPVEGSRDYKVRESRQDSGKSHQSSASLSIKEVSSNTKLTFKSRSCLNFNGKFVRMSCNLLYLILLELEESSIMFIAL